MNGITRFLVDKKLVEINGQEYYKLYFYDAMDGVIVTIVAPVVTPQMEVEREAIERQTLEEVDSERALYDVNSNIEGGHI